MKKGDESYRELSNRLRDMATKWLQECDSVEDVLDAIAREQLLSSMPTTFQIWVRERRPKSSREAGELAYCYIQARGDKLNWKDEAAGVRRQSKVTCFKCGEEGHGVAQC